MNALVFFVIAQFLVIIVLAVAFFALARQVGVLFERISPMGALVTEAGPRIGERSPQFPLASLTGGEINVGAASPRATLIFFLSPACPVCKKLLPVLRSVRASESSWLDIVLASDGAQANHHSRFIETMKLHTFPYVVSGELGMSYRVARLPFAVLLDATGVIRAKGLVNNREQLESLFNAVEMNVDSIQRFLNPSTPFSGIS
jgi:methylamine dehydrogenase accessory protein MauD